MRRAERGQEGLPAQPHQIEGTGIGQEPEDLRGRGHQGPEPQRRGRNSTGPCAGGFFVATGSLCESRTSHVTRYTSQVIHTQKKNSFKFLRTPRNTLRGLGSLNYQGDLKRQEII